MYAVLLALHNITRWFVVITAVLALVTAYVGWFGKRTESASAQRWNRYFVIAMDVQLLLGLVLYFVVSPLGLQAFRQMGMANVMGNSAVRFFAVEHLLMMVVAVVVAHSGSAWMRRAATDRARFRAAAVSVTIAIVLILAAIPWGRPLFPGLG